MDDVHLKYYCEQAMKYYKTALIHNENDGDCKFKYAKLLKKFKHTNQVFLIWNYMKSINGISLPLIIECYIKSINIDRNESIKILQIVQ